MWRLSRFAYLHREGDAMVLESSRTTDRVVLPDPAAVCAVAALVTPQAIDDLVRIAGLSQAGARTLVESLVKARAIEPVDADGQAPEAIDPALQQWEFHDRLFRAREPHVDRPAVRPARPPSPGPIALAAHPSSDVPFSAVLESRRSIRRFGEPPISIAQLGHFLSLVSGDPRVAAGWIAFYATIDRCLDLPAGLYRYSPAGHGLERVEAHGAGVDALRRQAMRCAELEGPPQVLFTLVAPRDPPSAYDYAAVLRDAGAVYQTMYLAATALDLAACALGTGDAVLFARVSGADALTCPAVGEFVLGSLPHPVTSF